ncbi:MAG: hypothetical protein AAGC43_16120 [Bacteroidota bacterium]
MNSFYYGIGVGVIGCIASILIAKLAFKRLHKISNVALVVIYMSFYILTGLLFNSVPESWSTKKINNPYQSKGFMASLLHLNQPKLSLIEVASMVFWLCLSGYFVYVLSNKEGIRRRLKPRRKRQGPRL